MTREWKNLLLLIMHLGVGWMASFFSGVVWIVALFPLLGGAYDIIRNKNVNNEAVLWAAYCVGAEVFLRMTGASLTYEIGKYSVLGLLMLGLLVEKRAYSFGLSLVYILLLLPSIFLIDMDAIDFLRSHILFNLSGPLCLFVALWYFNRRMLQQAEVEAIMLNMLLPVISMAVLISIKTPDFSLIKFTGSNFVTSGGFGPNQVATQLGLGMLIVGYCVFNRIKLFPWQSVNIAIFFFLIYRGALTLSRGGIIGAIVGLLLCGVFVSTRKNWKFMDFAKLAVFLIFFLVGAVWGWRYVDNLTSGQLYNRYTGRNSAGEIKIDPTSGREKIFLSELEAFQENPITGIGLGMGKIYRKEKLDVTIATHNEFGRMLAEHGLLGLIDIVVLFYILIKSFRQKLKYNRISLAWMAGFGTFAIITMGHSALRIAMPSFVIGLAIAFIAPRLQQVKVKKPVKTNEDIASHGYAGPGWSGARSS